MSANCIGFCQNEPNLTFDRSDGGGPTMLARTGICAGPAAMAQPNHAANEPRRMGSSDEPYRGVTLSSVPPRANRDRLE